MVHYKALRTDLLLSTWSVMRIEGERMFFHLIFLRKEYENNEELAKSIAKTLDIRARMM